MKNSKLQTNPPAIVRQVGETKPFSRWEVSQSLTEREIISGFFKKAIDILDNTYQEVREKHPRMFEK